MPIKASAKKELRKTKKRTIANKIIKDTYRKAIKTTIKSLEAGEQDLGEKLRLTQKALDKAVKRGVLKKNTAGRKLSRLAKKLKTLK